MKVGLTGGVASGKSIVLEMVKELGALTIDADVVAREVTQRNSQVLKEIEAEFGSDFFHSTGALDRKKLGKWVFADEGEKKKLEKLLHPRILEKIREKTSMFIKKYPHAPVVVDVPLLFETGMEKEFDLVWVIWVDYETQLKRLLDRENIEKSTAENMINSQISLSKKVTWADRVIDNSGSVVETREQVKKLYREIAAC